MGKKDKVFSYYESDKVLHLDISCPNTKLLGLILQSVCEGLIIKGFTRLYHDKLFGCKEVKNESLAVSLDT